MNKTQFILFLVQVVCFFSFIDVTVSRIIARRNSIEDFDDVDRYDNRGGIDKRVVRVHNPVRLKQEKIEELVNKVFELFDLNNDEELAMEEEIIPRLDDFEYVEEDAAKDPVQADAIDFMQVLELDHPSTSEHNETLTRHHVMLDLLLYRMEHNLKAKYKKLEKAIKFYDTNRNKKISIQEELPKFLQDKHAHHSQWLIRDATNYDRNDDGELNTIERKKFIEESLLMHYTLGVVGAFSIANMFDTNHDNHLDLQTEIHPLIFKYGPTSPELVALMTKKADKNGDNKLSINDLKKVLKKFFTLEEGNIEIVKDIINEYKVEKTDSAEI